MNSTNIIAFAGSNRRGSINRAALTLAVEGATRAGATVEVIDLREFEMPLYDAEWHVENGLPVFRRR